MILNSRKSLPVRDLTDQGFKVENGAVVACNGLGLKNLLQAGGQWLETHVDIVNALNVFPVPDGDTGTNMLLTMGSALEKVAATSDHKAGTIAQAAAYGALMGARGNSGVILSQFLQGWAVALEGQTSFTAEDFARATQLGAEKAFQSMVEPVEGTILTVAREAAVAAQQWVNRPDRDLVKLLAGTVQAAKRAQAHTPELLSVLKEAGVTDSGGQGLVYILEGGLRFMKGETVSSDPSGETALHLKSTPEAEEQNYGYDVQFLIRGQNLNVEEIRAQIDSLGQSTIVVGNEQLVKVHVHTVDPGLPISYGAGQGLIDDVIVENMSAQVRSFWQRPSVERANEISNPLLSQNVVATDKVGTVSVVPGEGLAQILKSLGINQVLDGGRTMNPSPQELLEAIDIVQTETVLIFPNHKNALSAAQQAVTLSSKKVQVIPTKTVPQGIAALLSFNYQADLASNLQRMLTAIQQVETIEVAQAARDSVISGFEIKTGDALGFLNTELKNIGRSFEQVVLDLFAKIEVDLFEIVTIYFGQTSSLQQAEGLAKEISIRYPELEVDIHYGGQSHYQYIISLE